MRMLFYRRRMWNHLITFDVTLALLFFYNLQEFSTPLDCDGSCMVYTSPMNTKKELCSHLDITLPREIWGWEDTCMPRNLMTSKKVYKLLVILSRAQMVEQIHS